jgi:hypothetical protein
MSDILSQGGVLALGTDVCSREKAASLSAAGNGEVRNA